MPPNNIIPRRILTRRSKDANVEASSVAQELPFVSANSRSEIPSSRVPTSSTSPHLHEDTQGYESESSLSIPENSTVSTKKRGRGATTGKSIEKAITENKGQLLEIEFPEGFKKPRQFANHLATGIGVVIRHSPELDCMSNWSDLAEHEKLPIYAADVHVEMENMRNELNQNESITSEREIVNKVLGKRSGYEKGLGYGVVASKCSKRSTCESSQLETVQEKLSVTEDELKDATCRIKSQQELIQTQEALIQNYDDRCKKQDDEIQGLREGQDELKQMLLRLLQQNSSSNQDKL